MKRAEAELALIDAGRFVSERGWVPATSGNLSARLDDGTILVTVSGGDKGSLDAGGFMRVAPDGTPRSPGHPSAETALHTMLYARFPEVHAVLHTHSPLATVMSVRRPRLVFEGYEILKAFAGVTTHASRWELPIFANDQDVTALAARVERHQDLRFGFLIEGHGLYAWGRSVNEARRHLEAIEFLLECERLLGADGGLG